MQCSILVVTHHKPRLVVHSPLRRMHHYAGNIFFPFSAIILGVFGEIYLCKSGTPGRNSSTSRYENKQAAFLLALNIANYRLNRFFLNTGWAKKKRQI